MSESTTQYTAICPACRGLVGRRENGVLISHKRYADGSGPNNGQPHDFVRCEGSEQQPEGEQGR